jgi:hypothetical protein
VGGPINALLSDFFAFFPLTYLDNLICVAGQNEIRTAQTVMIEAQERIEHKLDGTVADIHLLLLESKDHMTAGIVGHSVVVSVPKKCTACCSYPLGVNP